MAITIDSLKKFLTERVGLAASQFSEAAPLFSSGLVDSFSMLELITFIEEEESIRMSPGDVSLDNLDSIDQIMSFVASQR